MLEINPNILTQPFLTMKLSSSLYTARETPEMGVLREHHLVWPGDNRPERGREPSPVQLGQKWVLLSGRRRCVRG